MLDLRQNSLSDTIIVDGKEYQIHTDFRVWLDYNNLRRKECIFPYDLSYLFVNVRVPDDINKTLEELDKFYLNPNSTPHGQEPVTDIPVDYIEDGEYIYASFYAAYKIDLLQSTMHWWVFQALFRGLPDDSKMKQIMGFRTYKKDSTKYEQRQERAKRAWKLEPRKEKQRKEEAIKELKDTFYGAI